MSADERIQGGYVKLWRKAMESQVWADPDLWRTWTCCLMLANHKPAWVKVTGLAAPVCVEAGQFITGRFEFHAFMYPKMRKSNPCSRTTWRWLQTLESVQNVTIKTSNKFSIVSVVNWNTYQNDHVQYVQHNVHQTSSTCPADVQHVSTNKNDKNKDKDSLAHPQAEREQDRDLKSTSNDFDLFWQAYPKKKSKGQALKAWQKLNGSKPPLEIILNAIAAAKAGHDWRKDGGQFIPYPATWLNSMGWEDEVAGTAKPVRDISHLAAV